MEVEDEGFRSQELQEFRSCRSSEWRALRTVGPALLTLTTLSEDEDDSEHEDERIRVRLTLTLLQGVGR
jgi:hypothetical protein